MSKGSLPSLEIPHFVGDMGRSCRPTWGKLQSGAGMPQSSSFSPLWWWWRSKSSRQDLACIESHFSAFSMTFLARLTCDLIVNYMVPRDRERERRRPLRPSFLPFAWWDLDLLSLLVPKLLFTEKMAKAVFICPERNYFMRLVNLINHKNTSTLLHNEVYPPRNDVMGLEHGWSEVGCSVSAQLHSYGKECTSIRR